MNRLKRLIEDKIYYSIKYGFQRMFRGYDDTEVFDFDVVFIRKFTKILTKIKDNNVLIFRNVDTNEYMSNEEQKKFLNHWIDLLKNSDEDELYEQEFPNKQSHEEDYRDFVYRSKVAAKNRYEALELFAKYFDQLWE
jgi:hypothetical protein